MTVGVGVGFDLSASPIVLTGTADVAADLSIGTSLDLSVDPIVVAGAVAASGNILASLAPPGASAAEVWNYVLANGKTAAETLIENNEMLRIVLAAVSGTTSGVGSSTETYYGVDGTTPRVVATFDSAGNRIAVTTNGAP